MSASCRIQSGYEEVHASNSAYVINAHPILKWGECLADAETDWSGRLGIYRSGGDLLFYTTRNT